MFQCCGRIIVTGTPSNFKYAHFTKIKLAYSGSGRLHHHVLTELISSQSLFSLVIRNFMRSLNLIIPSDSNCPISLSKSVGPRKLAELSRHAQDFLRQQAQRQTTAKVCDNHFWGEPTRLVSPHYPPKGGSKTVFFCPRH